MVRSVSPIISRNKKPELEEMDTKKAEEIRVLTSEM